MSHTNGQYFMKLLKTLPSVGSTDIEGITEKRGIILSNYISLILTTILLLNFLFNFFFLQNNIIFDPRVLILLVVLIIFSSPIAFNYFHYTTLSRLILCYSPVVFTWYTFLIKAQTVPLAKISIFEGIIVYLLATSFIPYLVFDTNNKTKLLAGIFPTLFSIVFFDQILSLAGVTDQTFMTMRTVVSYGIVSLSCFTFHYIISQGDKLNNLYKDKLEEKTSKIKYQNKILKKSQDDLNKINLHLEELVNTKTKQLQLSLLEKEGLIRELHHRVKNNLQTISSLIYLKSIDIKDPNITNFLNETRSKIRSMALIHEQLLNSNGINTIDIKIYLTSLIEEIIKSSQVRINNIQLKYLFDSVVVSSDVAISCGVIVNELVTNSLKHAFPNSKAGTIKISFSNENNLAKLTVEDTGIGFPANFGTKEGTSFGMQVLDIFIDQLDGQLKIESNNGAIVSINFQLT